MSKALLPLFLVLALCVGCAPQAAQPTPEPTAAVQPTPEPTPSPTPEPDPVALALEEMTLEQKVGQLLVAGIEGLEAGEDAAQAVGEYQVGGVILFSRNVDGPEQLVTLTNDLKALNTSDTPLFLSVDEEGGRVSRMPAAVTDLPAALTWGETGDEALCRSLGNLLADACAAFGFNLDFAPVLDVWSNPDNTVIGNRAYSTDFHTAARLGTQVLLGLQEGGVIPVGKHFPGHGDTDEDSHTDLPVVTKSLEELEQAELIPFRAAIEAGAPAIMVGHIQLSALDDQRPASLSPAVVTGLLREELGFEGLICTDDLTMAAVSDTYGMGEAAVLAVEAGCDLLLVCHEADNLTQARDALLDAVQTGRISQARLDESVERILALKLAYGLSDEPMPVPDVDALNARIAALLPQ